MAKHAKTKTSNGNGSVPVRREYTRPAPYPKKSRVEVRYEGGPSKPVNGKPVAVKISTPQPSTKGKGKGKAVDKPESDLSTTSAANPSATRAQPSSSTFLIIAGSYEKLLYGLEGSYPPGSSNPTLKPIFIFPAHLACVKAIAASPGGKWLATGSEDEFVKVWDLRRRKEVGSLSQHEGSITSLHFPTPSHLVTTSVDSTISLFRTTDWALLKSLKGHSGRVNHVDVHPTGRVALSVGKDGTLRMWDLMRGRGAASLPLGSEAELVKFSSLGTHFAVLFPKKIEIYSLALKLLHTLTTTSRFNSLLFTYRPSSSSSESSMEETELLCVGTEKGVVEVYRIDVPSEEIAEEPTEDGVEGGQTGSGAEVALLGHLIGHTNRIKSISSLPFVSPSPNSTENPRLTVLLTSVSSDGLVNLYDLEMFLRTEPKGFEARQASPIASYDTKGSRLTCVFLADGKSSIVRQVSNGAVNCHIHPEHGSTGKADGTKEGESEDDYSSEDPYDSGEEAEDIQTEN